MSTTETNSAELASGTESSTGWLFVTAMLRKVIAGIKSILSSVNPIPKDSYGPDVTARAHAHGMVEDDLSAYVSDAKDQLRNMDVNRNGQIDADDLRKLQIVGQKLLKCSPHLADQFRGLRDFVGKEFDDQPNISLTEVEKELDERVKRASMQADENLDGIVTGRELETVLETLKDVGVESVMAVSDAQFKRPCALPPPPAVSGDRANSR